MLSSMQKRDEGILDDFRNGKLALLYRFIYPSLLFYARRYLPDNEAYYAEDYVQDAIFKAWKIAHRIQTLSNLKSFLYTAIRNECISHLRNIKARNRYEIWVDIDLHDNQESLILDAEVAGLILNAMKTLPDDERRVLELSFFEGKKNIEIAAQLSVSDSTVKKRKARALFMLRKHLNLLELYSSPATNQSLGYF